MLNAVVRTELMFCLLLSFKAYQSTMIGLEFFRFIKMLQGKVLSMPGYSRTDLILLTYVRNLITKIFSLFQKVKLKSR